MDAARGREGDVSDGATIAQDAIGQGCRTEFQHRDIRVAKVIDRRARVFYELEDLNDTPTDSQFYREE